MKERSAEAMRVRRIEDRLRDRGLYDYLVKVCKVHHAIVREVLGSSRRKHEVKARHELWLALHDDAGLSWPVVANLFEKTHDSIIQSSSKKDSRARRVLEDSVAQRIAAYVRRVGYSGLAADVERGVWREMVSSPACPTTNNEEQDGSEIPTTNGT